MARNRSRRAFRSMLLEFLETRCLLTIEGWHNFSGALDVNGDAHTTALDVLIIVNDLNNPIYGDPTTGALPIPIPEKFKGLGVDVSCDGFRTAIDALMVINAINSGVESKGWNFVSHGGIIDPVQDLTTKSCAPRLVESNSFFSEIAVPFSVPKNSSAIKAAGRKKRTSEPTNSVAEAIRGGWRK